MRDTNTVASHLLSHPLLSADQGLFDSPGKFSSIKAHYISALTIIKEALESLHCADLQQLTPHHQQDFILESQLSHPIRKPALTEQKESLPASFLAPYDEPCLAFQVHLTEYNRNYYERLAKR